MENLESLFRSFETGIRSAKALKPNAYLRGIGLDYSELRIGFNSGQFHHRKPQKVKEEYERLGLLSKSDAPVRDESMTAYTVFGRYGLIFPLLGKDNTIVNFFALRFDLDSPKEEYLNTNGIYPAWPHPLTKRLYIVTSVIDCASLLQSRALDQREAVMALHDGILLPQHVEVIRTLYELEAIIIIKW
jgi:hypothetical protein